jgi:ComF family protein
MRPEFTRLEAVSLIATLFNPLLDFLLPASCHFCGTSCRESPCAQCARQVMPEAVGRCPQCGLRVHRSERCGACLTHGPAYDRSQVACDYAPPLDQLVARLKYGGQLDIAPLFARAIARQMPADDAPELLCPVPLAAQRLAQRGCNQALEIARVLARLRGLPLAPRLLTRWRETQAQALLPAQERQANVRGAFVLTPGQSVQGLHVGVVDDVMTTGATLQEVAALLKRHGARRVTNLVFARTP